MVDTEGGARDTRPIYVTPYKTYGRKLQVKVEETGLLELIQGARQQVHWADPVLVACLQRAQGIPGQCI